MGAVVESLVHNRWTQIPSNSFPLSQHLEPYSPIDNIPRIILHHIVMAEEETKDSLHVTGSNAADTEAAAGASEGGGGEAGQEQQQTGGKPRPEPGRRPFICIFFISNTLAKTAQ